MGKIKEERKYLRVILLEDERQFTMLSLTETLRRRCKVMKIKYFNDTDTALVEFTENLVKETPGNSREYLY